ncbi:arginyltransferase 1 isoform X3 [Rhodnius prolixus]|uniref:arginyltransferase 1 isoform X3 n=1 Tax=Rhodnius prolixus TaxID=13249 RepID=UPI003D18F0D7
MNIYSQVEYMSSHEGYSCGYCKSPNTNFSHGMWAHVLSVNDYQNLIDRGWRRSGMYCYKPTMSITCCPLYTIRCEATHLKLTKSQKKILKKMTKFLKDGLRDNKNDEPTDDSEALGEVEGENVCEAALLERVVDKFKMSETKIANFDESVSSKKPEGDLLPKDITISQVSNSSVGCCDTNISSSSAESNKDSPRLKTPRPGDGMDPSKPQCKKAKILRLERKQKKNQQKENSMEICKNVKQSKEKSIEDWIKESVDNSSANKLEIRLLPANSNPEMMKASWRIFVKYQMAVHKETEYECSFKTYRDFLVSTPLQPYKDENGPPSGYGSFHQQYWLNGKLIAVGVIDILPKCVSSVYFFYDPDYSFLSLGTYGSLRELELVRSYAEKCPDLKYYYMGFYIHSCPKMRYKAKLTPSYLLCPEVYTWCSIEKCIPKLDASKYSRLNDDNSAVCRNSNISLNQVLILYNRIAMTYNVYKSKTRSNDEEEIKEYAELVGSYSSQNMLLLRH